MEIISNYHWRDYIHGFELPESEREDFDYMDNIDDGTFIKYKEQYYSLDEFLITHEGDNLRNLGWHGIKGTGFFDAIIIQISDCGDQYKVGLVLS